MNVCILLGRLKDDPNVGRHTSGVEIATMTIEEVVVQRDRVSGNPVERAVHHEVRVYNPAFVQTVKAEGARGRHVEVHGQLSYGDEGKAYVAVPSQGGRVAFKYFEVREIPSEPPVAVADHDAARDLASSMPEVQVSEPEAEPSRPDREAAAASGSDVGRETAGPVEELAPPEPEPATAVESRPAPVQTTPRPGFAARPPQIGGVRSPPVRPAPGPTVGQQIQERAPVADRTPPAATSAPPPPPARPSVGSMPARIGGSPVAGVVQPRAAAGPRLGGPVTRPTMPSRPAPSHPAPAAAVAGRPGPVSGGGIGRVAGGAAPRSNAWRGQMDDVSAEDDLPF